MLGVSFLQKGCRSYVFRRTGGALVSFCQICRHEVPGHEPNCPVFTQEPVQGVEQWVSGAGSFDHNQFLLDYARTRVLELQEHHQRKSLERHAQGDMDAYFYHQGALSVLVSMSAILFEGQQP
jgi:hypothetical protein